MSQLIIPWLATLLFGLVVFVVGRMFQASEKRRQKERKAAAERERILADALAKAPRRQEQELAGIMAAARDQGQHTGRRVH